MVVSHLDLTIPKDLADRQDGADFDAVYRSEAPWLVRFFRRRMGHGDDAQSLAQETLLRFLRVAPATEIETPRAYLTRIAANLLRDRSKMARRRSANLHVSYEDHDATAPSLERQLEARDILRQVDAAMLKMRPRTREVFLAVRIDGMTYAEVRERTGLSSKIIEKEMGRALHHINRIVAED